MRCSKRRSNLTSLTKNVCNKKFELMLTRRTKAYSTSG